MIETGAYGERMAGYLHLSGPPDHARLGVGKSQVAVTRLHAPQGFSEPTEAIPVEKAFSIHLHLRANRGGRLWLGGKLVPTGRPSGGVTILDLEEEPLAFFPNPIDVVQFYIPRTALEEFAYENGIAAVGTLRWPHCGMDTTLKYLGITVLSAIQQQSTTRLFLDYIGQAVIAHATFSYREVRVPSEFAQGQLAPWQARRTKEYLTANLSGNISLASMASECGLSVSHFARAFRRRFGLAPHRWLMEQRVDAVKTLLLSSRLTLAEIAGECGVVDQPRTEQIIQASRWRKPREMAPKQERPSLSGSRQDSLC
jgi:AraC family transcriptional regulator